VFLSLKARRGHCTYAAVLISSVEEEKVWGIIRCAMPLFVMCEL
jgi:hypothetical protein